MSPPRHPFRRCFTIPVDGVPVRVQTTGRPLSGQDVEAIREAIQALRAQKKARPA